MLHRPHISTLFPYTTLFRSSEFKGRLRSSFTEIQPGTRPGKPQCHSSSWSNRSSGSHFHPGWILVLLRQESTERSEEHTSELQSQSNLVCRLLLEKKKKQQY